MNMRAKNIPETRDITEINKISTIPILLPFEILLESLTSSRKLSAV